MNLITESFNFTFLTPCFSGTADGKARQSVLRAPPIRGHIRFWHREAFGLESANQIWGSTNGNSGQGSRVSVRMLNQPPPSDYAALSLPHKELGSRPALREGTMSTLQLQRLPACTNDQWAKAAGAVKLWLVAGTLGYRANRAAGSVWPLETWTPTSVETLAGFLRPVIARSFSSWGAAVVAESGGKSWSDLRNTASDTPRGPASLFGAATPRIPSSVKFKVVRLQQQLALLVLAPSKNALIAAEKTLRSKPDPRRWNELGPWNLL